MKKILRLLSLSAFLTVFSNEGFTASLAGTSTGSGGDDATAHHGAGPVTPVSGAAHGAGSMPAAAVAPTAVPDLDWAVLRALYPQLPTEGALTTELTERDIWGIMCLYLTGEAARNPTEAKLQEGAVLDEEILGRLRMPNSLAGWRILKRLNTIRPASIAGPAESQFDDTIDPDYTGLFGLMLRAPGGYTVACIKGPANSPRQVFMNKLTVLNGGDPIAAARSTRTYLGDQGVSNATLDSLGFKTIVVPDGLKEEAARATRRRQNWIANVGTEVDNFMRSIRDRNINAVAADTLGASIVELIESARMNMGGAGEALVRGIGHSLAVNGNVEHAAVAVMRGIIQGKGLASFDLPEDKRMDFASVGDMGHRGFFHPLLKGYEGLPTFGESDRLSSAGLRSVRAAPPPPPPPAPVVEDNRWWLTRMLFTGPGADAEAAPLAAPAAAAPVEVVAPWWQRLGTGLVSMFRTATGLAPDAEREMVVNRIRDAVSLRPTMDRMILSFLKQRLPAVPGEAVARPLDTLVSEGVWS